MATNPLIQKGLVAVHVCRGQIIAYAKTMNISPTATYTILTSLYLSLVLFALSYFLCSKQKIERNARVRRSERHYQSIKRALHKPCKCFWTLLTITNLVILTTIAMVATLAYFESSLLEKIQHFLGPWSQIQICRTEYVDRHIYHTSLATLALTFSAGMYFGAKNSGMLNKLESKTTKKLKEKARCFLKPSVIETTLPAYTLLLAELKHEEWETRKSITNFQENYEVDIGPHFLRAAMEVGPVKLEEPLFPDVEFLSPQKRSRYYIARDAEREEIDLFSFGGTLLGTAKPIVMIAVNGSGVKAFVDIVGEMEGREPFLCYMAFKDESPDFEAMQKLEQLEKKEKIPALFMTCHEIESLYDVLQEHRSAIQELVTNENASIVIFSEEKMKQYVDESLQALFWRGNNMEELKQNNSLTYLVVQK